MKNFIRFFLIFVFTSLFGCGGSSSDSEAGAKPVPISTFTPDTVPAERKSEFDLYLKAQFSSYLPAITGLYKLNVNGDISYYYVPTNIESNGYKDYYITAYNFLGDDKDNSSNCYLPAREGDLNFFLNTGTGGDSIGSLIEYKNQFVTQSGKPQFHINTPAGDIVYEIDPESKKVTKLSINQVSSDTGELLDTDNQIALTVNREFDITFSWITNALCKGLPASAAPAGFAGVYDTSTEIYGQTVENYLAIDAAGILHNWKYMGDGFSPTDNQNCYKKGQWYNRILNEQNLMYNKDLNYLFATVNQVDYRFYLDSMGAVISVGVPEPVETYVNSLIDVTISSKKSNITVDDLVSMECK